MVIGLKNDASFIIVSELNLFEQQSTYNPNMPFREFQYCSKLLNKWINENNLDLMNKCSILKEYSDFVAMVRSNSQTMQIEQAVEQTVVTFIERNGLLAEFFKSHRAEVLDVCITEYKEELHLKNVHAEGWAEGRAKLLFSLIDDGILSLEDAAQRAEDSLRLRYIL